MMTEVLLEHYHFFSAAGFPPASRLAVVGALRAHLDSNKILSSNYTKAMDELLDNATTYPPNVQRIIDTMNKEAKFIDERSIEAGSTVIGSLSDSTLFQRYGLIITVTDLLNKIKGQLFSYNHEIELVLEGVKSLYSILLYDPSTLFYLPDLQKSLSKTMTMCMFFVVLTIGGMMCGAMLGFANHEDYNSPLERNALSNAAGKMLVIVSFVMLCGIIIMVVFISIVFLVGCLGEIFVCRPQRDRVVAENAELLNFATWLLMDASVNVYHVRKLLRLSNIQQHCQSHLGISKLAGIHSDELEKAIDRIDDFQKDLVEHYKLNLDDAIVSLGRQGVFLKTFRDHLDQLENANFTKDAEDEEKIKRAKEMVTADLQLVNFSKEAGFKDFIKRAFLDNTLAQCDALKSDILTFLDKFDRIGNCTKINNVFETAFAIMCGGIIDYVNGYWSALLFFSFLYGYAIYICLSTSKYYITMTGYTYEGEPVPEGHKPEGDVESPEAIENKKIQELADKMKQLRLKKRERLEAEKDQGQVGIAGIAGMAGAAGIAGITGITGMAGMAAAGVGNILPVSMFLGGRKRADGSSEESDESDANLEPEFRS